MFEKEIRFITDFNLNRIKRLGSFFTLDDMISVNVHPAIVQYISAELDYLIYLDRQRLLQKSLFDYSGPEIVKYFDLISKEIKSKKLLPFEDVKRLVEQAVAFNVNYVLRPKWTLKKFIFEGDQIRNYDEIKLLLNYVYFYDFLKNILSIVLHKKNIISISNIEFTELLDGIQNELLATQLDKVLENGLYCIAEFINIGEVSKTKIAIGSVEIFLKEKGLHNQIYKIRQLLSVDPKQKFELHEVLSALQKDIPIDIEKSGEDLIADSFAPDFQSPKEVSSIYNQPDLFSQPLKDESIIQPQEEIYEKGISDAENISFDDNLTKEMIGLNLDGINTVDENKIMEEYFPPVSSIEEMKDLEIQSELIEKNIDMDGFQPGRNEEIVEERGEEIHINFDVLEQAEESSESEGAIESDAEIELSLDELNIQEEDINEEVKNEEPAFDEILKTETELLNNQEEIPVENEKIEAEEVNELEENDIFNYFTAKDTMKIISHVFNQDSVDFVNTLERISECSSFDEANELMKSVFTSYRINPFSSKEANILINRVEEYFREKK